MKMKLTKVFKENAKAYMGGKRRALNEGGTYSSKTWSILQLLIILGKAAKQPLLISVVSESLPHLKKGAMRDFFKILGEEKDNNPNFNKTDCIYTFGYGVMEFFGADEAGKVSGPRRNILFMNEANNIPFETARGLDIRTSTFTFADWNPVGEFWAHQQWIGQPENTYIHSTYQDALDVISKEIIANIESNRDKDPNWWNIYGLGLLGKVEGLVYSQFEQVDSLPVGPVVYGLDFGFSSDPSVLVKNVVIGDKLYSQEMFREVGLTNDAIAQRLSLLRVKGEPIFCDPDEPKSAEELRQKGFNVLESVKGKGSVKFGIQKVNTYYQYWTKDSTECIKEQRNFRFIKDRQTGLYTENTTHHWSHCLVAGTLIKTRRGDVPIESVTRADLVWTSQGWRRVLASGMTSSSEQVQTVSFSNGKVITGTPEHLIWVKDKGYTALRALRYADIMNVCEWEKLSTMESLITGMKTVLTLFQDLARSGISIVKSGLTLMGKSLKGVKSIIKTAMLSITIYPILNVCRKVGTISTMPLLYLSGNEDGNEDTSRKLDIWQVNGINPRRAKGGIANLANCPGKGESQTLLSVNSVGKNILLDNLTQRQGDFVQIDVDQPIVGNQGRITFRQCVDGVKSLSKLINTDQENVAPVLVLSVSELHKEKQPVFDLTISDVPEFFANGVLVHNSMDARRYALATYLPAYQGIIRPRSYQRGVYHGNRYLDHY